MAKDSRLVDIFRQELKKDKGIMGAFLSAASERGKEKSDIKNILPKSGFSGAIAEKMFGKSYRYGSKKDESRVERVGGDIASSKYLPGMAKDMNLMRLNMQKLVTLAGGKPSKTPSTSLLKGKSPTITDKKEKESGTGGGGMMGILGGIGSAVSGIGSSLLGGLGSLAGGILSIGGSIVGSIASMIGGIAGGFFSVIGGVLTAMGPLGMILAAGAGFVLYGLAKSIDFEGLKTSFGGLYKDITTGIKNFLGISDNSEVTLTRQVAKKLDNYFGVDTFNNTLDFIQDTFTKLSDTVEDAIDGVVKVVTTIFDSLSHDFLALTKNLYADFRTGLIMIAGAVAGSKVGSALGAAIGFIAGGPLGAVAGSAAGAGLGAIIGGGGAGIYAKATKSQNPKEATQEELNQSLIELKGIKQEADKRFAAGYSNFNPEKFQSPDSNFGTLDMPLKDKIALIEKELEKRQVGATNYALNNIGKLYNEGANSKSKNAERRTRDDNIAKDRANRKLLAATSPQKVTGTSGSSYAESIAKGESGGNYNIVYGSKHEINGKPVVENTIGEVIAWQKSMAGTNRQAAGKYQFMNVAAEAEKAGLSMNDKFDGVAQEKMMAAYTAANAATLNRLGLEASAENLSMAHAVGVGGTKKLLDAQRAGMGNANSLQVLGLSGNAASTNPQLNNSVDYTIARLSNKVKGMPAPLLPPETQNLALAENKQDDLFAQVLDILREMLSGDTKQSTPIPVATATPNTTRSVSSVYNNTDLFKKNYMEVIGKQYADYQA